MNYFNENQGRSKEQVERNEQVGSAVVFFSATIITLFVIFNALLNG